MSKIKNKFLQLKKKKERALIAYIMAGFPNEKTTMSAVKGLVKGGADIIEIRNWISIFRSYCRWSCYSKCKHCFFKLWN